MNLSLIFKRIFCLIKKPKIIICLAIIIIIIPFISIDWVYNIVYNIINDRDRFSEIIEVLLSMLWVLYASGKETIEGSGYDKPDIGRGGSSGGESAGPSNPNPSSNTNPSSNDNEGNQVKEEPSSLDKGKRKATEQEVLEQERKRPRVDPPWIPVKQENLKEEDNLNRRNFWEVAVNYDQDKNKEPNKISSDNSVEHNDQHITDYMEMLIKEDARLLKENYKVMVESIKEKKLSKDINLSLEERNMHKDNSENLKNRGEIIKNHHEIIHRTIREQLEITPDSLPSEYDEESSEYDQESSEDDQKSS